MTLNEYVSKYNGKAVDVDKMYGAQCWDNAAEYSRSVVGVPGKTFPYGLPTGDGCAAGVYHNFPSPLSKYYQRIPRGSGTVPKPGDLVVWNYNLPNSGGCGHVAIVLSANASGFVSFDQNWGGKYCHKVSHSYQYVLGFLRPIQKSTSTAPVYYSVKAGDYLLKIAAIYKTTVSKLLNLNPTIKDPNKVYVGQKIRIK